MWDLNSGTSLTSYKGDSTSPHGLCLLGNQYLLGAANSKPLIHVWALQRRVSYYGINSINANAGGRSQLSVMYIDVLEIFVCAAMRDISGRNLFAIKPPVLFYVEGRFQT